MKGWSKKADRERTERSTGDRFMKREPGGGRGWATGFYITR